ncbi:MAG TPA: hypothetical protein DEH78_24010 [Solibacterales bacterium]|nr:hypothetical protein [Bryobacterales bacterium]
MDESKAAPGPVDPSVSAAAAAIRTERSEHWAPWIAEIAAGDESALARLYDATSTLVYSLALRVVGNPADAEEVAADVYSQVWRSAGSYDPARSSVLGWLVMMTRSRAIDRVRARTERARRETGLESPFEFRDPRPAPEDLYSFGQRGRMVRGALSALPQEQRELIELSFFQGLSHAEVAERKTLPLGTVKTRIRLGITKLRDLLASVEESGHGS